MMKRHDQRGRVKALAISEEYRYPALFLAGASLLIFAFSLLLRSIL